MYIRLLVEPGFDKTILLLCCRVQANYMVWRAVASAVSSLTADLRKRQLAYGTSISGRTEREPRWKECVGLSAGRFVATISLSTKVKNG